MAVLYRDPHRPPAPAEYLVHAAAAGSAPSLDDEATWSGVPRVEWGPERYLTWFCATWSPDALWIRFDCRDEHPWHTLQRRDDPLWQEEVVEMFLDPVGHGRDYAEIEISPANVVCDLRVRHPWPALSADPGWDLPGFESHVSALGAGDDVRSGWRVTARLPWEGLGTLSPAAAARVPPSARHRWRFNVFRIKRPWGPTEPERDAVYAAWSVPDAPSFHVPDLFRDFVFVGSG
jgi:hypothetical protein